MDESVIRKNAKTIYRTNDLDKAIFKVDRKGELHKISKYNLLGRFVNWCKGLMSKEGNREKVCQAFALTVEGMVDLCDPKLSKSKLRENYIVRYKYSSDVGDHYEAVVEKIVNSQKYGHTGVAGSVIKDWREKSGLPQGLLISTRFVAYCAIGTQ